MKKRDRQYRLGLMACWLLALISLGCAAYSTNALLHLIGEGEKTTAVVTDIHVGVKGAKRAVLEFRDKNDRIVRARDIFLLFFIRPERGDHVNVLFDSHDPMTVTLDLGLWTWQQPAVFYLSFLFLGGLGLFLQSAKARPI